MASMSRKRPHKDLGDMYPDKRRKPGKDISKKDILRKFEDWFHQKHGAINIRHLYMGDVCSSTENLEKGTRVIVSVIESEKAIKNEKYECGKEIFNVVYKLWDEVSVPEERKKGRKHDHEKIKEINRYLKENADSICREHSNIEIIRGSLVRIKTNKDKKVQTISEPCIAIYCSYKGVVPIGEKEFPRVMDGYATDIREGFFHLQKNYDIYANSDDLLEPLRMGASISKDEDSLQEKENLLLEFWNWLTKTYKTLKVRRLYIGQENAGTTGLNREVIVLVTDDFRFIKETKFNYYRNSFPIICKSFRYPSPEGAKITGMEKDIVFDKSLHIKIRKCIQHISSSLFEKHSNLEIISASGFRSLKNGEEIIREPCIVFYCACKGVIPFGESEFPKIVSDIQTDVREGFFYQFPNDGFFKRSTDVLDPLMMGGSISSKDLLKGGTLGGFVTLTNGDVGFITCAHVLFDLSAHCDERAHFDVVQPAYSYNNTNNVCGVHESSFFPTTPFQQCTLDVSLVKLTNRIPERGLFSDLSVEDLLENGFNIENLPEYSEGTIRDYRQEHFTHLRDPCFKWGAKTGFTKGALRLNGISVRWSNDVIDLGNPSSQCSFVYHSQLECLGTGTSFALPGDSGALVFQLDPMATKEDQHRFHCIGMIVGGTSDFKTIVTPIGPILEALNVKMHTFPQEKMDES